MTFREAISRGLLRVEEISEPKPRRRVVTLDGAFELWRDPRRPAPYRWVSTDSYTKHGPATQHGGAESLEEALRYTVLLRERSVHSEHG